MKDDEKGDFSPRKAAATIAATVHVSNIGEYVTEDALWRFCLQAGPVVDMHMFKDKESKKRRDYASVQFESKNDVENAKSKLHMKKLGGKPLWISEVYREKKPDIGANLFVGNLGREVDEKVLYETFSKFGCITAIPKILRGRGYGFIKYNSFDAADEAIKAMDGSFLCNKKICVSYSNKKGGAEGERHGTYKERLAAAALLQDPSSSLQTSVVHKEQGYLPAPPPPSDQYWSMVGGVQSNTPPPLCPLPSQTPSFCDRPPQPLSLPPLPPSYRPFPPLPPSFRPLPHVPPPPLSPSFRPLPHVPPPPLPLPHVQPPPLPPSFHALPHVPPPPLPPSFRPLPHVPPPPLPHVPPPPLPPLFHPLSRQPSFTSVASSPLPPPGPEECRQ